MERADILELMTRLKLYGMRAAYDEVMTTGIIIIGPDQNARNAARLMLEHKIGALPVLDGERLIGIITETDVLRAFARTPEPAEQT